MFECIRLRNDSAYGLGFRPHLTAWSWHPNWVGSHADIWFWIVVHYPSGRVRAHMWRIHLRVAPIDYLVNANDAARTLMFKNAVVNGMRQVQDMQRLARDGFFKPIGICRRRKVRSVKRIEFCDCGYVPPAEWTAPIRKAKLMEA